MHNYEVIASPVIWRQQNKSDLVPQQIQSKHHPLKWQWSPLRGSQQPHLLCWSVSSQWESQPGYGGKAVAAPTAESTQKPGGQQAEVTVLSAAQLLSGLSQPSMSWAMRHPTDSPVSWERSFRGSHVSYGVYVLGH